MAIIKFRRGLSAVLAEKNPLLREGEPCLELDTGKLKIGNGISRYLQLGYLSGEGAPGPQGEPGINGTDGVDGQSAYELAVSTGFVGTEAQWLLSLKGEPGPAGTPGSPGAAGPAGPKGDTGAAGADSTVPGPKGDTGDTGPAGPAGADYSGPNIASSSVAPSSPAVGDVWIDTSA